MSKLYVITGGPGVGKTTLLNALAADEMETIPEAARVIIKEQLAIRGDALPWENKELYTDLMLAASIGDYSGFSKSNRKEYIISTAGSLMRYAKTDLH